MKIAIVVQRYGHDVIGGAETLARQVAEKLVADPGWDIHVITTTARDYQTWENYYPEGWSELNGVSVRRFDSRLRRSRFFALINGKLASILLALQKARVPVALVLKLERAWFSMQGPVNPGIARYISDNLEDYDRFIFFTYLYLPTIQGIEATSAQSILVPAAHDEKPFHFLTVKKMIEQTGHILANSVPERQLLISRGASGEKVSVAGMGIDDIGISKGGGSDRGNRDADEAVGRQPYVLYLGRISSGKQVDRLIVDFESFHGRSRDVRLVLAGRKDESFLIPERSWLDYVGFLEEGDKTAYIENAACIVNPSALESLSLIVIEAMACGRPVLVNNGSPMLRYFTEKVDTVFGYGDEISFVQKLSHILSQDWQDEAHTRALDESRRWVLDNYSWERVMAAYRLAITGESAGGPMGSG